MGLTAEQDGAVHDCEEAEEGGVEVDEAQQEETERGGTLIAQSPEHTSPHSTRRERLTAED